MKESILYEKLPNKNVRCQTCAHYCVLKNGQRGLCGVRENISGTLYFLVHGVVVSRVVDPIEKKPFFHFLPRSQTYSIATVGCNFKCKSCKNYGISQGAKNGDLTHKQLARLGERIASKNIVTQAKNLKCASISYTFTEPTVFLEYALRIMKKAKREGLKNLWMTNGFFGPETRKKILPYLDGACIEIKSLDDKFYRQVCKAQIKPVLETAKKLKEGGVWLEIKTIIIPGLSDSRENLKRIAHFIADELGPETPWHVSHFSPEASWQLHGTKRTPQTKIRQAYEIGKNAGLMYVYTGNLPGLPAEDTFCPKCKTKNIDRHGFFAHRLDKKGRCRKCGFDLNITG